MTPPLSSGSTPGSGPAPDPSAASALEYLSIASHEIRSPLCALLGHLQLGLRLCQVGGPISSEQMAQLLRACEGQARRVYTLTQQLVETARIDAGVQPQAVTETDLVTAVSAAVERLADELTETGCPVRIHARGPARGLWDRACLDQILGNLLSNAAKHGAGGAIEISVEGHDGGVRLVVRDHGPGIAADEQARVFERFYRGRSQLRTPGLGLGLYIVRRAVEALGGRITLASAPGEGAAFTVELPRGLSR